MTDTGEIDESTETPRRRCGRSRLLALLAALLLAATAVVAFGAGSASAQTQNGSGDADQQQADDSSDEADGTCDKDGARRGGKLGRFGMGDSLTEVLGLDAESLREQLKGGSTLADVAAAQGVDVSEVIDALVTAISDKAAEHDREVDVDAVTERVTAFVNGERPEPPDDDDDRRGRRGLHRGGFDGARHLGRHA